MFLAIILQDSYLYILWLLLFLAIALLLFIFYNQLIVPYMEMKKSEIDTPPEQGAEYFFITSETERTPTFVIGKNVGNIVTKCSNIEEDHLVFQFKKDPLNEEYTITIKRHGSVLFKPPRMAHYAVMAASEKLESHEVIGKKAEFRISNKMIKERMSSYIEISLTTKFIINKTGKERMQFIFKIEKIHPSFNFHTKDGDGNFPLGKEEATANVHD